MFLITYTIRDEHGKAENVKFVSKTKGVFDFPGILCFFDTFSEANTVLFKLDRSLSENCRVVCTKDIISGLSVKEINKLILPLV